jgi:UDP-glucose 6-dehydrogenase
MSVLIIGCGVVGSNLAKELSVLNPECYDKYKGVDTRKSKDSHYDIAFVCVDTPKTIDSVCDISEVVDAINTNNADVFVIKSTVLPEQAIFLNQLSSNKHIVISPEYYGNTPHCNNFDFGFTILGGDRTDCIKVQQILQYVYDARHTFRFTDCKTASLAKYMENCYLAMKVSFCTQFYSIAEKARVDYEELRELFVLDPRVNPAHTFVYRDHPYWDSHCLNKDVNAIADTYDAKLLTDIIAWNDRQKEAVNGD